jgi:hypothetical protein
MKTYRRFLSRFGVLCLAVLVASVTGTAWGLKLSGSGPPSGATALAADESLVCFG